MKKFVYFKYFSYLCNVIRRDNYKGNAPRLKDRENEKPKAL